MFLASSRRIMSGALFSILIPVAAAAAPMTTNRGFDLIMSNDAGALYGDTPTTYFLDAPGGGLNQLHITTDPSNAGVFGQVTTRTTNVSSMSGTFWVTTTGGRGYNDDVILLFSMQGPVPDDFSLTIKSSGYQWTPSTAGVVTPIYKDGALQETFDKSDFRTGPQTAKPGPGTGFVLPFHSGQNINDPATAQYLMFIDLNVGNDAIRTATDSGNARVDYTVDGLYGTIADFNAYAWAFSANVADGTINWTNNLSTNPAAVGQSGYSIVSTAAPVPAPGGIALFGGGMLALAAARHRRS